MEKDKVTYIGQAKNGTLSFFRSPDGDLLIDYISNRVNEFVGKKANTMRAYDKDGEIQAELIGGAFGGVSLSVRIPCLGGRDISNAAVDDLLYAVKEDLISPSNFKFGKTMEGIFKLFLIRRMV